MTEEIKWTEEIIKTWLEDAVRTLRRLPPVRVQGHKSNWPDILYTEMEKVQMGHKPIKWPASAADISRMEMALEWIQWIDEADERHLLWKRAERLPWKVICHELGASKQTLWVKWKRLMSIIVYRLNNEKDPNYEKNHKFLCRYSRS
ncbi:MAG: DUF6362 family protein [Alphaproteobacteria bacterium]